MLLLCQPKAKINTKEIITTNTETEIISKEAVDELINKAAQQKYLQDVFNSKFPTLPNKHALQPLPLKPLNNTKLAVKTIKPSKPLNEQRCTYANQSYVPGDIVKTEKGWIRCTPTLIFLSDKMSSNLAALLGQWYSK